MINQDRVAPGRGCPPHPHSDMGILSFVLEGALKHQDSLGNEYIIHAGELQRMTTGRGIVHSEFNASQTDPGHFLQIWILPQQGGLGPGYEISRFESERAVELHLLASPDGREGSAVIQQQALLFSGNLKTGGELCYPLDKDRHAWLQLLKREIEANSQLLLSGAGLAASDDEHLKISTRQDAKFLLFDLT